MKGLLLVITALLVLVLGSLSCAPSAAPAETPTPAPEVTPPPSPPSYKPKVYGDGDVLVTFEVKIPEWTPEEDRTYLVPNGYMPVINGELSRGIPMQEKEENIWAVGFLAPANQVLEYKYNRNGINTF